MKDKAAISKEKLRSYFETAVQFLGRDWIVEEDRKFYESREKTPSSTKSPPQVVAQYHRALEELGYREAAVPQILSPDRLSEDTLRMVNLGRYISELDGVHTYDCSDDVVTSGIPESLSRELKLINHYEKAMFEIQIAAGYARQYSDVQMIEEGDKPEVDIRIPTDDIYIECKRVDSLPQSGQKLRGVSETLFSSIESKTNREAIIIFEFETVPDYSEARRISQYLPDMTNDTKEHHIKLPYGDLHILPFYKPNSQKSIARSVERDIHQWNEFIEHEVRPMLKTKLGIELHELVQSRLTGKMKSDRVMNHYKNPVFFDISSPTKQDYIQPILNQFQSSRRKFGDSSFNILHIDIPNMMNKMRKEDIQELQRRIGGLLWKNPKISVFCLSTEQFRINTDETGFEHIMNKNRKAAVPEELEIGGIPLDMFIENIHNR